MAFQNFKVLNTTEWDNEKFYGSASASGQVTISGYTDNLVVDAQVTTGDNSSLHVPLSSSSSAASTDLISFTDFRQPQDTSAIQNTAESGSVREKARGNIEIRATAGITPGTELLIEMYAKIQEGYDVVGTRRADRKGEPPIRSLFAKAFYWLINKVSDTEMVDGARDFRLMTRQVVDAILELKEVNRFSKGLFSWVGFDVAYVSYENRERVAGETSWSFWSLLSYSLDGFINFSEVPLKLATWAGTFSFLISLVGIVFVVIRKLTIGGSVAGWASLVSIILFIG